MAERFSFTALEDRLEPRLEAREVFVIAEIGINHNGSLELAKQLIDVAKTTGCDAVKFQKRTIDIVYTPEFLDSPRESPWGTTQRDQKQALEFGRPEFDEIDAYCRRVGIAWFASAWDLPSQAFLRSYNLRYNKIASAMIGHHEFLETVAEERKVTFVSTAMSSYVEIDQAVEIFRRAQCPFVPMHCVGEYPATEESLNLRVICELQRRYSCPVGYSGHEAGVSGAVLATMLGAVAVERHITLDRSMYGSDQAASLEKRGLELMVGYIRSIPTILGDGVKRITETEQTNSQKLRYYLDPRHQAAQASLAQAR